MSEYNIWGYQPAAGFQQGIDLIGYKVEAKDGVIGKISKHSDEVGASYVVVDTGVWIFGKHGDAQFGGDGGGFRGGHRALYPADQQSRAADLHSNAVQQN